MEVDPTRVCELLVGLPAINVLGVDDVRDEPIRVHVETRASRPGCATCGTAAQVKDRPPVELVDPPEHHELGPGGLGLLLPPLVDRGEQRLARLGRDVLVHQERDPAREVRVLHRHERGVATVDGPRRTPPYSESDVERYRHAYLEQLDIIDAASQHVFRALTNASGALRMVRQILEDGGNVSDLANLVQPGPLRNDLVHALDELERARHKGQCLLFRLLHGEGNSMTQIATAWGISRQLVSRLVNEPID